jgi:hypothetical protein
MLCFPSNLSDICADHFLPVALYCVSSDSQHNPRAANRTRSFHCDYSFNALPSGKLMRTVLPQRVL